MAEKDACIPERLRESLIKSVGRKIKQLENFINIENPTVELLRNKQFLEELKILESCTLVELSDEERIEQILEAAKRLGFDPGEIEIKPR